MVQEFMDEPPARRKLTVIIPCFNERETILETIEQVKALSVDKTIFVIDNCSTDGTRELLCSICRDDGSRDDASNVCAAHGARLLQGDNFRLVLQPRNMKKGASVRLGIALASSEYIICQDADQEYHPPDILHLLEYAERTGAVAVFGTRLAYTSALDLDAFQFGRVALTKLFCVLYDSQITDVATCYKLLRTDVIRSIELESTGFDLDFEIPAKLRRRNHPIYDIPIRYRPRTSLQGKKLRWRDGWSAIWTLFKCRVSRPG